MALISRFAFFVLLLLPNQCKAKAENCSETQCRLLPVGDYQVAYDFRLKASEKGVRLVYINLVIGNSSYDPLELPDEFLPHRWIWAHTALEPMLSLPEDYDLLSAGLLTYQVKSIDVKLKDQPNGCLAKLNSTCQNLAVGRMLLQNVTSGISSDKLLKNTPVVCVAVINTVSLGANMWYRCCYVHKEATGPATIRCDKRIDVGEWMKIVNSIFLFLSFFLALFAPALPLALPDYVFSLEDEVEKENHPVEHTSRETTGYERIVNPATVGQQDNQRGTGADGSNMEDVTANFNFNMILEETVQDTSNFVGNSRDKGKEREFIPVDDSSPMILSTLLRESVKKFPDVPLSFNVKLAVMCFCVYPCVLYVQIGLYHTLKKTYIVEMIKKQVPSGPVFSQQSNLLLNPYDVDFELIVAMPLIIMSIVVVLFSRPKDFILEENEVCQLCRITSAICSSLNLSLTARRSMGDEIHRHLRIFHHFVWYALLSYGNILASICDNLLSGRLREEMHQELRGRHLLCVCFRFISLIVALPFIIVGGVLCLLILIVVLIVSLFHFSPLTTVYLFIWNKIIKRLPVSCRGLRAFYGWLFFASLLLMGLGCSFWFFRNFCHFVSSVVSYVIIGLALNVSIVTPFLAFFLVLTTNVYSCYSKTQGKYREVKKMIWTRLQELQLNSNVPKDAIRAEIYWFVCDKVLPIKSELCRMLRNMVLVVAFLFLALSSIVFCGNKYDISTLTTTISVFFTGSIPLLFSKVVTTNRNIIGWAKIEMEGEIDKAITVYRDSSYSEALLQRIADA